ncbi:enoyl reductase [Streptosporangium becharense]|uniref:Enoyl reductase n=1 Tax=Streptosporangium becharense TaxID=1816182 RepID=A0A7W9IES8_9ACTN|nr:hypothetical protein [Streptosporangium becharense]MBB2909639.1 enoyl reductase [Streptosporangium becharense]MBB5819405.1 enoyl reductase [Streptosporangium becharense]
MIMNVIVAGLLLLDPGPPSPQGDGFQDGRRVGVQLANSKIVITGTGLGARSDGYRIKRPCWYEPGNNAADMLQSQESVRDWWFRYTDNPTEEKYQEFLKQFRDRVGQEGRWWSPAYNSADPGGLACWMGLEPFVWVPPGTTPPAGITVAELAEIARAALTVPEPEIELNPDAKSYVNLPTWVWLSGVGETTRSVTATLPGVMSATVTATLSEVRIDPGTTADRAEVKEDCGPAGRPYTKGGAFTCGVRYLRASIDQPRDVYELTVTSVWTVDVDAEGGEVPFDYDPVEVGATRDVPVGEVQSTVRRPAAG